MIVICNVQINKQDIITRKIDKSKDIPLIKEISVKCFPDEDAFDIVNAFFDIEHFYVAEFVKEKKPKSLKGSLSINLAVIHQQ